MFAERFFGFHLGRRQWVGITITAAGLVVIGLTSGGADETQRASLAALIAIEGAIFAIGAVLVRVSTRRRVLPRAEGLRLGAAAGALFGVSDIAIKWLTQAPPGPLLGLLSPWTLTRDDRRGDLLLRLRPQPPDRRRRRCHRAHLRGRQPGRDHWRLLVFHEPLGSGPLEIGARLLAFWLVIAGAALMPAPMRAAPDVAGTPSRATSQSEPA